MTTSARRHPDYAETTRERNERIAARSQRQPVSLSNAMTARYGEPDLYGPLHGSLQAITLSNGQF